MRHQRVVSCCFFVWVFHQKLGCLVQSMMVTPPDCFMLVTAPICDMLAIPPELVIPPEMVIPPGFYMCSKLEPSSETNTHAHVLHVGDSTRCYVLVIPPDATCW